jgi:hypothetical protein
MAIRLMYEELHARAVCVISSRVGFELAVGGKEVIISTCLSSQRDKKCRNRAQRYLDSNVHLSPTRIFFG